jgi:hypothetical protein
MDLSAKNRGGDSTKRAFWEPSVDSAGGDELPCKDADQLKQVGNIDRKQLSRARVQIIDARDESTDILISKCLELLKYRLDPAEVDSLEVTGSLLDRNGDMTKSTCLIAAMTDEKDNVLAVSSGSVTTKGSLLLGYTVTAQGHEGHGLGSKVYSELITAAEGACVRDFSIGLKWLALEATNGAEEFWRRLGFKSIRLKGLNDHAWRKFKYLQPPIEWDYATGKPVNSDHFSDALTDSRPGESNMVKVPLSRCLGKLEELMIKPVSGDSPDIAADDLFRIIRSIYREFYFRKHRVDRAAYPNYFGYFASLIKRYHAELASAEQIQLF